MRIVGAEAAALLIALPLLGALAALAAPRAAAGLAVATSATTLALALALAPGGSGVVALGGWAPPLGIALRLDGLAWAFVAMTAAVFALAAPAARGLLAGRGAAALWLGLLAGMNALYLTRDMFNLFVALEVAGLCAVALTALGGGAAAARAATGYLIVSLTGGLLYLAAVAALYRATGALDAALIAQAGAPAATLWAALGLASVGLLLKGGAAPLHGWLPPAHAAANPAVSALLSGVAIKGPIYALARLWFELAPDAAFAEAGPALAVLGAGGAVIGAAGALRAERLKRLIAYSTVAQVGFMTMALGIAAQSQRAAAAMLGFVAAHGLAKAALFLAAGEMARANGHDEVRRLADPGPGFGPAKGALAIAAAALVGLPPTGGFVAKWTLAQASVEASQWWGPAFLVAMSLVSAAYLSPLAAAAIRQAPPGGPAVAADPAAGLGALALAAAALALGFAAPGLAALAEGLA